MFSHLSLALFKLACLMRVLLSKLGRSLLLFPDTLPCFVHCNGSRFLDFVIRAAQVLLPEKVQRLAPTQTSWSALTGRPTPKNAPIARAATPNLTIVLIFMTYL